jgi:hypothetical protein
MKIKEEYKGKTIIKYDSILGEKRIIVNNLDPKQFTYYQSVGLGYLFEPEAISYTGIEQEPTEEKPKRRRKKSE